MGANIAALDRFDTRRMAVRNQNARAAQREADRLAREQAAEAKAAAEEQRRSLNNSKEADFRTRGVKFYTDADGNLQPERDEAGGIRFNEKTLDPDYSTGDAVEKKRLESGAIQKTDVDAGAEVGTHPDRPNELYRKDKATPWNYVGTVEDGLKSADPKVRDAATKAKGALDKDIAETGSKALELKAGAVLVRKSQAQA
jgi:hypothetical protein